MKRILFILLAVLVLAPAMVIGIQQLHDPGSDQPSPLVDNKDEQVIRGTYLARAGNCMGCHTARGGQPYAGGRSISTPFGAIYTSNLTPDDTGLGKWTKDDFWRAMHNGKSKDGSFLYPAFPYPNYTKVTRADSDALFAYFQTLNPVKLENKRHDLRFPYNQRILLAFWRTLYFTPGQYQVQTAQSAEWNRGAYLVQGLGHCSACHTSRNALGGSIADERLGGGMIPMQNWYASALTGDKQTGLGEWEEKDIADLLKTGVSQRGAVFGPMAEVVSTSLQHLSNPDIQSMAVYLKTIAGTSESQSRAPRTAAAGDTEVLKLGAKVYEQQCAACHGADGKGAPPDYPPLAGNHSLAVEIAMNPVRIVLNGGYPPGTAGNPRPYGMPPFGSTLSDGEVAAVVSYIRASWGNHGEPITPDYVTRLRGTPVE